MTKNLVNPFILQWVGFKNSGKTTFITKSIRYFVVQYGIHVATLKHDVHDKALDKEGKDTWKHLQAGAVASMIQSPSGLGLTLLKDEEESVPELIDLLRQMNKYDMIMIEGFKTESYPKVILLRHREDMQLIQKLSKIQFLIFWREEDQLFYKQEAAQQTMPRYPSFFIKEEEMILHWLNKCWLEHSKSLKGRSGG